MATEHDPGIENEDAQRLAALVNHLLTKMGYPDGQGIEWWLHTTHEQLGGLTAMQAWAL